MATGYYSNSSCSWFSGDDLLEDANIEYVDATDADDQHIKILYKDGKQGYSLTVEIFCSADTLTSY